MNLNEHLQQAYEAGRRQGLNENLPGITPLPHFTNDQWQGKPTQEYQTSPKPPTQGPAGETYDDYGFFDWDRANESWEDYNKRMQWYWYDQSMRWM